MEMSLKTGFAQTFSCCPKNLSCPKFGGAAAPLAPPPARTPMHGTQFYHARLDVLSLVLITRVLTFPHVKLTQSTLAQRWSKSVLTFDRCRPALRNLWLLLSLLVLKEVK